MTQEYKRHLPLKKSSKSPNYSRR